MKKIFLYILCAAFSLQACQQAKEIDLYAPPEPVIVTVQPDRGADLTEVTIMGRRFSGNIVENTVKFNGIEAVVVEAADNLLKVLVPENAGTGKIVVTVNGMTVDGPTFYYSEHVKEYLVSTFAGSTGGSANGLGTAAQFTNPGGLIMDLDGNLIVFDRTNHLIRKIAPNGLVSTFAGDGANASVDGTPGSFSFPWQGDIDQQGNIFLADKGTHKIRKITPAGVVSTIAGTTNGFLDGDKASAKFNNPLAVVLNESGEMFVADRDNHRIRKIVGNTVSTLAGTGATTILKSPTALCFDKKGNLIVADMGNFRIVEINSTGTIETIAGTGIKGFSDGTPNKPLTAQFGDVYGLAVDSDGNILIADASNRRIRMIELDDEGGYTNANVKTIAGTGAVGKIDGLGLEATFNNPYDVAVDANNNIYVAEASNHLIRKIVYK